MYTYIYVILLRFGPRFNYTTNTYEAVPLNWRAFLRTPVANIFTNTFTTSVACLLEPSSPRGVRSCFRKDARKGLRQGVRRGGRQVVRFSIYVYIYMYIYIVYNYRYICI